MPQLDPSSFASQIFWLAVTFTVLYFIMVRLAIPRITSVFQNRQERIANDLDTAEKLQSEAEQLNAGYQASMAKTRKDADNSIAKAIAKAATQSAERHAQLDEILLKKAAVAEERISTARQEALGEISSISSELSRIIVKKLTNLQVDAVKADSIVKKLLKEV